MPMEYVRATLDALPSRLKACVRTRESRSEVWSCNYVYKYAGKGTLKYIFSNPFFNRCFGTVHIRNVILGHPVIQVMLLMKIEKK